MASQNQLDRSFRSPFYPVAYAWHGGAEFRLILVGPNHTGRPCLRLYSQATHAPHKEIVLTYSMGGREMNKARDTLQFGCQQDAGTTWNVRPVRPLIEQMQQARGSRFHAQFYRTDYETGTLVVTNLSGTGAGDAHASHMRYHPAKAKALTGSDNTVDLYNAPALARTALLRLRTQWASICPQSVDHELTRLIEDTSAGHRVSPLLAGVDGPLCF